MKWTTSIFALAAFGLAACGGGETEEPAAPETAAPEMAAEESPAPEVVDPVAGSVAHPDRPADDVEGDERRKPAETLGFIGLEPGMTVIDMEAGGGYFTELYSRVVGKSGKVYMQNPPSFDGFLGDALETRLGGERLGNVVVMRTNFDNLDAPDGSVDVVTWIQGPHELWFEVNGESLGDPEATFAEIARVLKPGGVFVAIDHRAAEGAGTEAGGTVHRIEEEIIRSYAEGAGLVFKTSADFLSNTDDPLTNSVFDPSIRGQTDQFVIAYEKPE